MERRVIPACSTGRSGRLGYVFRRWTLYLKNEVMRSGPGATAAGQGSAMVAEAVCEQGVEERVNASSYSVADDD